MLYYDLHIHSCLSPCADKDMTPQNVCRMAKIKGLDLIAITDHNTGGNLQAFAEAARKEGLMFLPGMEICAREEVHILAYFPDVEQALKVSARFRSALPSEKNKPDYFGRQFLVDAEDRVVGEEEALLISALNLPLKDMLNLIRSSDGVAVPAHIHRGYGLVHTLGFIPKDAGFKVVEQSPGEQIPQGMAVLRNSDAHELGAISERTNALPADSLKDVLRLLREGY